MARLVDQLTEAKIRNIRAAGFYPDGRGLYLQVRAGGARSWIFRFTLEGRTRDMGLGALADVGLVAARTKAAECRALRAKGFDPIEHCKAARALPAAPAATANVATFREFAEEYIRGREGDWKNTKHRAQWRASLEMYAYPIIGDMPVSAIETKDVLAILLPNWKDRTETMNRVRGRIERVLAAASVEGLRTGNPALWKGHLSEARGLSKRAKAVSFAALPYRDLPAFLAELRARKAVAAQALEFLILCTARTSEVLEAQWTEIDEAQSIWVVPGERMKAGRAHVVPLSSRSLEILNEMKPLRDGGLIFPSRVPGRPLSSMAMLKLIERMGYEITAHGFRATFKTWAEEETQHTNGVIEAALAHIVGDKTERAYMRGDRLEKRRALMNDWCAYCTTPPSKADVIPMRTAV